MIVIHRLVLIYGLNPQRSCVLCAIFIHEYFMHVLPRSNRCSSQSCYGLLLPDVGNRSWVESGNKIFYAYVTSIHSISCVAFTRTPRGTWGLRVGKILCINYSQYNIGAVGSAQGYPAEHVLGPWHWRAIYAMHTSPLRILFVVSIQYD
jgi:hypothetical protein